MLIFLPTDIFRVSICQDWQPDAAAPSGSGKSSTGRNR